MNRDSNAYTFLFAAAMVLVVASSLAFTATSLKSRQADNIRKEKMQNICDFLGSEMVGYDWVGFYLSDVKNKKLHLGPFYGEPTEHTSISYGMGICGQAAEAQKTFLIDDVKIYWNQHYL